MTAALDYDLLTIHTAPTVDLTEPAPRPRTITAAYETSPRRPLRSPVPDPGNCSPDELLDYAANCRTHRDMRYDMTDDLKLALISLIERQSIKLDARDDEIRALTNQLAVQQGIGAKLEKRVQDLGQATIVATNEMYEERILRVAAQQDYEDMRQTAIRRGRELTEALELVGQAADRSGGAR